MDRQHTRIEKRRGAAYDPLRQRDNERRHHSLRYAFNLTAIRQ